MGWSSIRGEMGRSTFEERKAKSKIKYYERLKFVNESRKYKVIEKSLRADEFRSGWNKGTKFLDKKYSDGKILNDENLKDIKH